LPQPVRKANGLGIALGNAIDAICHRFLPELNWELRLLSLRQPHFDLSGLVGSVVGGVEVVGAGVVGAEVSGSGAPVRSASIWSQPAKAAAIPAANKKRIHITLSPCQAARPSAGRPRMSRWSLWAQGIGRLMDPVSKLTRNSTKNTTNSTWAIQAEVPAMPPNPRTAATSATTRNINAQYNMIFAPCW
jgi:hypothetical protein